MAGTVHICQIDVVASPGHVWTAAVRGNSVEGNVLAGSYVGDEICLHPSGEDSSSTGSYILYVETDDHDLQIRMNTIYRPIVYQNDVSGVHIYVQAYTPADGAGWARSKASPPLP